MRTQHEVNELVDELFSDAARRGLIHLTAEEGAFDGRLVTLDDRTCVNFTSCSYLGLEMDDRLKQGAIEATMRYGTQFSSSRAYVSAPPYREYEQLLETLFEAPILVTPTTTLGHLSALPVLLQPGDAVIMDQQVHHSVQMAMSVVQHEGLHRELIRHNHMDRLEDRINELRLKYRRIWYLADGIYSMYGDLASMGRLRRLLDSYEQFHLYIDDAHGMSWTGRNGRGSVLGDRPIHPKMVVAVSLNKAFAAGGGLLVFPDAELKRKVRTCGGPLIFSGPLQPPMLGAGLASVRLHLSGELEQRQATLLANIRLFNQLAMSHGLPLVSQDETPIRYIGMGVPRVPFNMVSRLMADGFYVNVSTLPAVPMKRGGVRIALTTHQTPEDIHNLIGAIARHLPEVMAQEKTSLAEIGRTFAISVPDSTVPQQLERVIPRQPSMFMQHELSIEALDPQEWDSLLGARGTFSWKGMRFLEQAFRDNPTSENNWTFHYYIVRDELGKPILATFFTESLWKDDMLFSSAISRRVEEERKQDPYYLTTRYLAMGSLLTEGNHLYLDRSKDWREALSLVLNDVSREQEATQAGGLVVRDVPVEDEELAAFLTEWGLARFAMPESFHVPNTWKTEEEFYQNLSFKSRRYQRLDVRPWNESYRLEVVGAGGRQLSDEELEHLHRLYRNVKERGFEINAFELPTTFFREVAAHGCWELVLLYLRPEAGGEPDALPAAFAACFLGPEQYVPHVCGLDYRYVQTHGAYRQLLRHTIERGHYLGKKRIQLGYTAAFEKHRFGAKEQQSHAFVQIADHYHSEVLALLQNSNAK